MPITRLVPWAVLVVSLAATGILYASILHATATRKEGEYADEIDHIREGIKGAVQRQVSVLQATTGLVQSNPHVSQSQYEVFYRDLTKGVDAQIPEAIGFSLWRPWRRRDELRTEATQRGAKGYELRPPGPRAEAHAVILVMPLAKRRQIAPGFDMYAEPVRHAAMDVARHTGSAAMTRKTLLANDPEPRKPAFLIYLPVFEPDGKTLKGFVYAGMRAEKLFKDILDASDAHVGLRLWSVDRSDAGLVYDRPLGEEMLQGRSFKVSLPAVGSELEAEATFSPKFGAPAVIRPWVIPCGTALSLLLFLLATTLGRAQEASERREAEQGLLAEVGRLTAGAADTDDVLQDIAVAAGRAFEAVCRIDLLEADGGLRTVTTRRERLGELELLERDYPRLQHDPLLRKALETGKTQMAKTHLSSDEGHRARVEALKAGPVLVVPLWVGERAIGAVSLVRSQGTDAFTPESAGLAEAIAGRLALAIDNVRLYRDLELRVEERTRDLEASNHELESFCYSVSHDLRTPLRSLDGFGRVLEEDYGDRLDAEGLGYLERIRAATRRMDELITALLTLSRLTRREIVPVATDVTAMVTDMMHDLDPDSRVRLIVADDLSVRADPRMLAVVLDNLLGNAIKFSGRTEAPEISVGQADDGSIFVRDNGAGFDMAYAAKLFQPFERLHSVREFPGHGIGLATVERILRRHGGEVRAEGRPGEGATFFVKFPD